MIFAVMICPKYVASEGKPYVNDSGRTIVDRAVLAGFAAGIVAAGLILSPLSTDSPFLTVQADHQGGHKTVTLIADEVELLISDNYALHPGGMMYNAMVFNGTIPGPVIAVDQGDMLEITLINEGNVIHSLDFHAGIGPSNALSGNVGPNETKTWTLEATNAGAFLYHCGAGWFCPECGKTYPSLADLLIHWKLEQPW